MTKFALTNQKRKRAQHETCNHRTQPHLKEKTMTMLMERHHSTVTTNGLTATIPSDTSMLAVFCNNDFIDDADYNADGYIYIDNKPIKKWFKKIDDISIHFPILNNPSKLQQRLQAVKQTYKLFANTTYKEAYNNLVAVKQAHAHITHKFEGNYDPFWLYTAKKYSDHIGISFDWVDTPKSPINIEIGTNYYNADHRLMQLRQRVYKFRTILERSIWDNVYKIPGEHGQTLQLKLNDSIYWFAHGQHNWEKLCFPENNLIKIEL